MFTIEDLILLISEFEPDNLSSLFEPITTIVQPIQVDQPRQQDELGYDIPLSIADLQNKPQAEAATNARRSSHNDPISSKFDFDGDQFANSLLEVSVSSDQFPAEIHFGSPYEDPFANVDFSQFGSVSGTVTDKDGNPLNDFFVEFFKASASMDQ